MRTRSPFYRATDVLTEKLGTPGAVLVSFLVVAAWAISGPSFGFSDTWQLIINTSTTVVTFWMVFIIQASQNRDTHAIHAKLDALLEAVPDADDKLARIEKESVAEIERRRN
jgi:low affinity Fe/Cu permease